MRLADYLFPVSSGVYKNKLPFEAYIDDFPDLEGLEWCLIGYQLNNTEIVDQLRIALLEFSDFSDFENFADLGNFVSGSPSREVDEQFAELLFELSKLGLTVLVVADDKVEIAKPSIEALEQHHQPFGICEINQSINGIADFQFGETNTWLNSHLQREDTWLVEYALLGYQSYYVQKEALEEMRRIGFEALRLGQFRMNTEEGEVLMRASDAALFNIRALNNVGDNLLKEAYPNGFGGDEACLISRYAGACSKLRYYAISGMEQLNGCGARLIAQMIWYFAEGVRLRCPEFPLERGRQYATYNTHIEGHSESLRFVKSLSSNRWWLLCENENVDPVAVPCTYRDYEIAAAGEIPDRWVLAQARLSG